MKKNNPPKKSLLIKRYKDKTIAVKKIIHTLEKATGKRISTLRRENSQDQLFALGSLHCITTKKALCTALKIPVEGACRFKRKLEKRGRLVESAVQTVCPITGHLAYLITTNPNEFEAIQDTNQQKLF